jgi:hypothetical protein
MRQGTNRTVIVAGDWIKLHRKLLESPIMQHDGLFRLWGYCLMRANWKESKWLIPGTLTEISVPRGAFISGRESLHHALYPKHDINGKPIYRDSTPTSRTVWRWLEALAKMECVNIKNVSNRCSIITVCNYNVYQDDKDTQCPAGVQPVSSRCPAGVQPVSTEEEDKNLRKKERKTNTSPPATAETKTKRPPDELFDAIAEVTGSDPKASGSHIGKVRKSLLSADPPYTAEEVRRWLTVIQGEGWMNGRPSLGYLEQSIGKVRAAPLPSTNGRKSPELHSGLFELAREAAAEGTLNKEHGT